MKILVISADYPFPPHGGGLLRTYHILRMLSEHHDVTLASFSHGDDPLVPPSLPVRVVTVAWEPSDAYHRMNSVDMAVSDRAIDELNERPEPWFVSFYESQAMENAIGEIVHDGIDVVLFEGTDMAGFSSIVPASIPRVLDLMDVHSLMAQRAVERAPEHELAAVELEFERTHRFERMVASNCRACLVCSENEAIAAREYLGVDNVIVIPNGVDAGFFSPTARAEVGGMIVFTGAMSYQPNVDAVKHFAREIFPGIIAHHPNATFHIVGARPSSDVEALAGPRVVVHGRVPDVRPFLYSASVVVIPLLSGGGTRLKILEAAASASAMVSTTVGVEGLSFDDGKAMLVADSAADFIVCVSRLLKDAALRAELGREACIVAQTYDWNLSSGPLLAAMEAYD